MNFPAPACRPDAKVTFARTPPSLSPVRHGDCQVVARPPVTPKRILWPDRRSTPSAEVVVMLQHGCAGVWGRPTERENQPGALSFAGAPLLNFPLAQPIRECRGRGGWGRTQRVLWSWHREIAGATSRRFITFTPDEASTASLPSVPGARRIGRHQGGKESEDDDDDDHGTRDGLANAPP